MRAESCEGWLPASFREFFYERTLADILRSSQHVVVIIVVNIVVIIVVIVVVIVVVIIVVVIIVVNVVVIIVVNVVVVM